MATLMFIESGLVLKEFYCFGYCLVKQRTVCTINIWGYTEILTYQTCHIMLSRHTEERVNSKCQSVGPSYILHLLALVKIRLFNLFFWERKMVFGILMKTALDARFS